MTHALIIQRPTNFCGDYYQCKPNLNFGSWKPNLNASTYNNITAANKSQICISNTPILPLVISPKTMTKFGSMFDDIFNLKEMKRVPYRITRPRGSAHPFACLPSFQGNLGEVAQLLLKIVDTVMGEGNFVSDDTRWSEMLAWIDSILRGTFLMAVPKKRTSKSKRRIRQNVWKKKALKMAMKAFSLAKSISSGNSTSFFVPQRRKK